MSQTKYKVGETVWANTAHQPPIRHKATIVSLGSIVGEQMYYVSSEYFDGVPRCESELEKVNDHDKSTN